MIRSKIVFVFTMLLMLGAGVVLGWLFPAPGARKAAAALVPAATQPERRNPFDQLNLGPEQRKRMDAIWAELKPKIGKTFESRRAAEKDRDEAIQKLLGDPAQHDAYEKIMDDYHSIRTELDKQRQQLIHEAEDRGRALLDDQQKKKWDEMSREREHDGRGMRRPASRSATMPSVHPGDEQ